jgi:hypothetical protein
MANLYWYGGTGNWSDYTNHWSNNSGNSPSSPASAAPTSADNAIFDANSGTGTVTVNATANCLDLDFTNTSLLTMSGSSALSVYGNLIFKTGMTLNYSGTLTMKATSSKAITTSSNEVKFALVLDGVSGIFTLQDAYYAYTKSITLTNGTFDANEKTLDITGFSYYSSNTRTLDLSNCTINIYGSTGGTTTNLTTNFTGSTIRAKGESCGWWTNHTFNDLVIENTCNHFSQSTSSQTYNNVTVNPHPTKYVTLFSLGTLTVTGTLTANGSEAHRIKFYYLWGGTGTLTAAAVSLSYVDFHNVNGAGAAAPFTGTSISESGYGGTNITGDTPRTLYWVGNGGSYSDSAHWSLNSNGTSGEAPPRAQDTVIFDNYSFSSTAQTVTLNRSTVGRDFNASSVTNSPTLSVPAYTDFNSNSDGQPMFYGNVNFGSFNFSLVASSRAMLVGYAASGTYDLYGHTGSGNLPFLRFGYFASGTTINQRNAIAVQSGISFENGITYRTNDFNIVINNVTGNSVSISSGNSGNYLYFGTSSIIINNDINNASANMGYSGYFYGNWTLSYQAPTYATAVFTPYVYSTGITIPNLIVNGKVSFSSVSATHTITNITIEAGKTLQLKNGYTCNVSTITSNGTGGSKAILESTTAGSAATISKASGSIRVANMSIKDSTATGGASFKAVTSTSVSGNTGWQFITEVAKTGTAKASIKVLGITKTATAKARIKTAGIVKTVTAKARIKVTAGALAPYIIGTPTTGGSTISHTVVAGTNVLVVTCGRHQGTITNVAFDGTALTRADWGNTDYNETGQVWYLANPTAKTANVVISTSGGSGTLGTCINLGNVGNTTPENHQNNDGDSSYATLNYQTLQDNAIVIECEYSEPVPSTVDNATIISTQQTGNSYENLQSTYVYRATASTVQIGHDLSYGGRWASAGASWVGLQVNTKTSTAKAKIVYGRTKTATAKANIGIAIQKTDLVTPANPSRAYSPVTLVWEHAQYNGVGNLHYQVQVDKTSNAFGDLEVSKNTFTDYAEFEYWDGNSWEVYPSNGLSQTYVGNQIRLTTTLTIGAKYWRVRAYTT